MLSYETPRRIARSAVASRRGSAGYTIIEVLVVILVFAILAAAAVPTFYQSLCHHRLEGAARRVKQDLEYLRDAARAKSATLDCQFNGLGYSFTEATILHLDRSSPYAVDLGAAPYDLDGVTVDFEDDVVVEFDGFGDTPLDGTIVLQLGSETRTVNVQCGTGQIFITNP
jgi:prepilin-type N-terminal cleavage/methylation domain-containing protein